ncbi:arrestin domain-containing protein 3-like isoform X2 [Phymastichus coffea]|uniref:arrestin domain-containing protein 3-like isoform X2 n=1 Tax=Phymastichus coffea TaxID=108790 RepID=UPI00273CEEAC|nr:arrestin domain-containing protein 3-like isoform X2 [Phymastichus coffea]
MDNISEFDIKLEKEVYYAGETIRGHVILHTSENFKLRSMRLAVRGQAHAEWKVLVSGERRNVKDDQYFVDERTVVWGQESSEGPIPILPRGKHQFPFAFQLPESALPCSFESRTGYIRYYVKATVDRPYASPPQGLKYFTLLGPHIDCMDEQYLPVLGREVRTSCCFCCRRNPVELSAQLERSAYVCGESIKLRASIDNRGLEKAWLHVRLTQVGLLAAGRRAPSTAARLSARACLQYVEFFLERGVLGTSREIQKVVMEYKGEPVPSGSAVKWDSSRKMVLPCCPPTLVGVCRLIKIYYVLKRRRPSAWRAAATSARSSCWARCTTAARCSPPSRPSCSTDRSTCASPPRRSPPPLPARRRVALRAAPPPIFLLDELTSLARNGPIHRTLALARQPFAWPGCSSTRNRSLVSRTTMAQRRTRAESMLDETLEASSVTCVRCTYHLRH